jgi:integrase/recombinase XerD
MSDFAQRADEYLQLRRALGFKLNQHGWVLPKFVAYLDAIGASTLTADHAITWAGLPQGVRPIWLSQRLSVVRGFARYLQAFDPATEVPPLGIWRSDSRRPVPYLYSQEEVLRLLAAARELQPALRAASHETLFGLLSVSGMRVGEALDLLRGDVDLTHGVVTVRRGKFNRSRLIPLHPTATKVLHTYAENRDRLCPRPIADTFFVSHDGTKLTYRHVCRTFHRLAVATGIRSESAWPRIHDLRHSFAVRTLVDLQRAGADIHAHIGTLSIYLGHVKPAGTYWYISAAPELMELAAGRLERQFGDGR